MALDINRGTTHLLSIKDSIRILPGALGKLAKDWKVPTKKDHFPHYFWNESIPSTLSYVGDLPPYTCFEPKRTSETDYQEMIQEFRNPSWSFLNVSRDYILRDCIALYEILLRFFNTLNDKFPINPLTVLSAPSAAFKIWRTTQLPLLQKEESLSVFDFSNSKADTLFRKSYCGGIVDVYRPHLRDTTGYYYDINSLYPTAMIKPMPVGMPKTIDSYLYSDSFFGFIEATVTSSPDEYIGLLPIKYEGKLICPKGTFRGLFFSESLGPNGHRSQGPGFYQRNYIIGKREELNFALQNGYKIDKIHHLYSFQRGVNCFRDLIEKLNTMKIEAQLNDQPTIRNVAKLLMNSMYGRFGMHIHATQFSIIPQNQIADYTKVFNILSQIDFGNFSLIHYNLNSSPLVGDPSFTKLIKRFNKQIPSRTNVAIASAVTAYSRMIINQYKLTALSQGLKIYYSDTDSLVVDGVLPSHLLDNAELGKLKLEHKIKEGIFVMPKVYYLLTSDNKEVLKCKGYPGKLTHSDYLSLLKGETLQELQVNKWQRSLKDSNVQIKRNQPYYLRFIFNKRQQVIENGKWVNTTPLIFTE